MTGLSLALLYLVAAVLGVVVCRSLKLPPMLGYLVVGVLIGPNALAFAQDTASLRYLAEFGVVFLMFVIGLEFNLPKLRSMRTLVFGLGMLQVIITVVGAMLGNLLLVWVANQWRRSPNSIFSFGRFFQVSRSDSIMLKVATRGTRDLGTRE